MFLRGGERGRGYEYRAGLWVVGGGGRARASGWQSVWTGAARHGEGAAGSEAVPEPEPVRSTGTASSPKARLRLVGTEPEVRQRATMRLPDPQMDSSEQNTLLTLPLRDTL